jgi:hypothetical protein
MDKLASWYTFAIIILGVSLSSGPASAELIPGGGSGRSDCYAEFDVEGATATSTRSAQCTDGDPACDFDGLCGNNSCRFHVAACLNQHDPAATSCIAPGPDLPLRKAVETGRRKKRVGLIFPAELNSSTCGAFVGADVPTKRKAKKPGRVVHMRAVSPRKPRRDTDALRLFCLARVGDCPTTTTTTTTVPECPPTTTSTLDPSVTTTTTTLAPGCGDGIINGSEECDPPCSTGGGCGSGEICDGQCQCVTQSACTCGTPEPQYLKFTTAAFDLDPMVATGSIDPLHCAQCTKTLANGGCTIGASCMSDTDCPTGHCRGYLIKGGLYFGSGTVPNPLPAAIPDLGTSFNKTCCIGGNTLALAATTPGENTDITPKTCSGAGCFFGAPLPILNGPALSTCVINTVAYPSRGSVDCSTGDSTIDLPLTSTIYLTGDFLNGQSCSQPDIPGIQPCPICTDGTCKGGSRNGLPCTPGTTALTEAYPTSQDCPVGREELGSLPIPFLLTTGMQTKTATDTDGTGIDGIQVRTFCAFCRDPSSSAFEGADTHGPAVPCISNADCTRTPFTVCEQKEDGAFGNTFATTITETGSTGGDLTDHLPHDATLASVFCIPPTYSGLVDPAAGLPGPGAVSLPGQAQLVP